MAIRNYKSGFTIIELLMVVALIGILASIIMVSLENARRKANLAAFKHEVSGSVAGLIAECDSNAITTPAETNNVKWTQLDDAGCGVSGDVQFTITANPRRALPDLVGTECDDTLVDQDGAHFSSGCK